MEAAGAREESASSAATAAGNIKRPGTHSGRLLLRMPESLHGELARASERAGVSLNTFINNTLAGAVGGRSTVMSARAPEKGRRRFVERLLLVNLLVLSAVGVLAIVLLVQALR